MEKYEVEDFGIDSDGELLIQRKGEEGNKYADCPFTMQYREPTEYCEGFYHGKRCGRWCPLFGDVEESTVCKPYQLQEPFFDGASKIYFPTSDPDGTAGIYQIKSISLCHKTIWCRVKEAEANKEE